MKTNKVNESMWAQGYGSSSSSVRSGASTPLSRSPSPAALLTASNGVDFPIEITVGNGGTSKRNGNFVYREMLSTLLGAEPESRLAVLARQQCCCDSAEQRQRLCLRDRSGPSFEFILNFLRKGQAALLPSKSDQLTALMEEAEQLQMLQLVAMLWCLTNKLKLQVFLELKQDAEVVWNAGVVGLLWKGVAVMTRCYFTHKHTKHLVVGYMRAQHNLPGSPWWCYDVVCPGCQLFDFAPIDGDGINFEKVQPQTKRHMKEDTGRIVRLIGDTCALVDWESNHRFHVPLKALLPINYTDFSLPNSRAR